MHIIIILNKFVRIGLDNKIPDIVYEKHKHELIGLGISDMHR